MGIIVSDSVGTRSLWKGCESHRCGSSTCPRVKLPSPLSLFILSKIKSHQLIHIFLNTGDGECKPKEKTTIPGRIQVEERMDL